MFLEKQESGKLNRGGECYYSGLSVLTQVCQCCSAPEMAAFAFWDSAVHVCALQRGAVPADAACVPPSKPAPAPLASSRVLVIYCLGR